MTMPATYVYAVIPCERRVSFEVAGMDDDHDEVHAIPNGGLAAVVGASPLADYRGLKRDQAVRYLLTHQRVVEAVMHDFPVLPLGFGSVLPDESWAYRLLDQGAPLFRTTLDRVAGRVQMELVVLWNLQQVFAEIGQEAHIVQLKQQAAARPPQETQVERVAVGQMVHASLQQRRAALQEHIVHALRQIAQDVLLNPAMDDSMVANVALLLDQAGREALDRLLATLDRESEGRLLFRCVGPLPPYSFATLEVDLVSFQAVEQARRLLGLAERVASREIKHAYRQLAAEQHPDRNRQDPQAEARMAELTQGYKLLSRYAGHQAPTSDQGAQAMCSFVRQSVEQTLLIALRGQEAYS